MPCQGLELRIIEQGVKFSNKDFFRNTAQKKKFSIKDFFSKCDPIHNFQQIWSHLLKKYLMGNFIFCTVSGRSL